MSTRRRFLGTTLIGGFATLLSGLRGPTEERAVVTAATRSAGSAADVEFRRYLRMAAAAQAAPIHDA